MKKEALIALAIQFREAGGMYADSEQADSLHELLATACDNAPDHGDAIKIVESIIPNFNY